MNNSFFFPFSLSFFLSFFHPSFHPSLHAPIDPFIASLIYSFIHLFVYSFIYFFFHIPFRFFFFPSFFVFYSKPLSIFFVFFFLLLLNKQSLGGILNRGRLAQHDLIQFPRQKNNQSSNDFMMRARDRLLQLSRSLFLIIRCVVLVSKSPIQISRTSGEETR